MHPESSNRDFRGALFFKELLFYAWSLLYPFPLFIRLLYPPLLSSSFIRLFYSFQLASK